MAFFGLTSLGAQHFQNTKPLALPFHAIPAEEFESSFLAYQSAELDASVKVRCPAQNCPYYFSVCL